MLKTDPSLLNEGVAQNMGILTKTLALTLGLTWTLVVCGQEPGSPQHDVIMEKKLECAQELFAAVTTGDFEEVNRQAQKLRLLSQEAGWNRLQTPEYMRLSADFRGSTSQIEAAADEKNLDAVGLAFVKLSITCIDCHRHTSQELPGSAFTEVSFKKEAKPTPVRSQ